MKKTLFIIFSIILLSSCNMINNEGTFTNISNIFNITTDSTNIKFGEVTLTWNLKNIPETGKLIVKRALNNQSQYTDIDTIVSKQADVYIDSSSDILDNTQIYYKLIDENDLELHTFNLTTLPYIEITFPPKDSSIGFIDAAFRWKSVNSIQRYQIIVKDTSDSIFWDYTYQSTTTDSVYSIKYNAEANPSVPNLETGKYMVMINASDLFNTTTAIQNFQIE